MIIDPHAFEPLTARAWPAARQSALGGWRLFASAGHSLRINSCWPLAAPDRSIDAAIDAAEAWYLDQGLAPIFKLADGAAEPADLGRYLQNRGYSRGKETLVMTGPLSGQESCPSVCVSATLDDAFAAVLAATAPDPADGAERLDALARVAEPRLFARIDLDDQAAAIGACAIEGEWAGIFGMRTHPDFRRLGLASKTLHALLARAAQAGAARAYLQVEAKNTGAIALYRAAGFEAQYRYFYWEKSKR